jgi:hypothetical protein
VQRIYAAERVRDNDQILYRGTKRGTNGYNGLQTSAKYSADLRPEIVTPYPRQREINRHVATFRVK